MNPTTVSACSNCHNATMKIRGDVTKYYVCGVCHRPCDPAPTNPPTEPTISLCQSCYCMTKTIDGKCGKCKADKVEPTVEKWEIGYSKIMLEWIESQWKIEAAQQAGEPYTRMKFEADAHKVEQKLLTFIRTLLSQSVQEAKAEEQSRIWKEGWKLIEWHKNPKNQFAGILHANATINAIQDLLEKVRPSGNTPENSTLNTKSLEVNKGGI